MGADTPNILSRETTFIMGILKKCFVTEKVQDASNSLISGPTADERTDPSTEGVFCHSAPPTEDPSTEGVFCHSAPPTEGTSTEGVFSNSVPSTEAVFCHSNPLTEASLNFAGSSQTTDQLDTQILQFHKVVAPINHHFLFQIYPSLKIRWNLPMQTCSKVLANSQVNPTN